MKETYTITYEPDNAILGGQIECLRGMVGNLVDSRWLLWQLFMRDLLAVYKQSFLGVFWIVLTPLITLATFIILNNSGIFSVGNMNVPYPIFAILGLSLWQVFATGLITTTNSITSAGGMIKKINFPRETLVFSSMAQPLVAFLIQVIMLIILFVTYGYTPTKYILLLPFMAIPVIMLTLGLGLVFSLINGVTHDLGRIIGTLMTFFLVVTPIMYANPKTGVLGLMAKYNLVYYLIDQPRNLILTGAMNEPAAYALSVVLSAIVFLICWRTFYLTEVRVAERI